MVTEALILTAEEALPAVATLLQADLLVAVVVSLVVVVASAAADLPVEALLVEILLEADLAHLSPILPSFPLKCSGTASLCLVAVPEEPLISTTTLKS